MLKPFRVLRPTSVAEASRELRDRGEGARIYAGGSELLVLLRRGFVDYDYLVDIKHIPDLGGLAWDGQSLHVGANVTHRQIERHPVVMEHMPLLADVEAQVANVRVRNVGTLGGNLCFSDPHSDPGTLLLVYDAEVTAQAAGRQRRLPLEEFLVGIYETALEPDELLTGIDVPALPAGVGAAYERVHRFERPSVGVAAAAGLEDGRLKDVRLAVGCVGPKPMRLREIEDELEGLSLDDARRLLQERRGAVEQVLEPVDDLHGSVDYKTYIVTVLLGRALARAASGNGGVGHD